MGGDVGLEACSSEEVYRLPLYLTLAQGSPDPDRLLDFLQAVFEPAGICWEVVGLAESQGAWSGPDCPFEEELDHSREWLHGVLLDDLPTDRPVLLSCGRCCLIGGHGEERGLAQALARLLGLSWATEGLMSPGQETSLNQVQCEHLRNQAAAMLGLGPALEPLQIPVWAYQVESPACYRSRRSHLDVDNLLAQVNDLWQSVGVEFKLEHWCHLSQSDVPAESWRVIVKQTQWQRLQPIVQHGANALHLFWLDFPDHDYFVDRTRFLGILCDRYPVGARDLARLLGQLGGVNPCTGPDQLMGPAQGLRISPLEATRVRDHLQTRLAQPGGGALARAWAQQSAHPERVVKVKVHLVRGASLAFPHNRQQAEQWLAQANAIWAQARIRLEISGWNEPVISDEMLAATAPNGPTQHNQRVRSCRPLCQLSGYDPDVVNLFWVHKIPFASGKLTSAYQLWRAERVLLVAERFYSEPVTRNLARALAALLGLKLSHGTSPEQLVTSNCLGTVITPDQIRQARHQAPDLNGPQPRLSPPEQSLVEVARVGDQLQIQLLPDSELVRVVLEGQSLWLNQSEMKQLRRLIEEAMCLDADATGSLLGVLPGLRLTWLGSSLQFELASGRLLVLSLETAAEFSDRLARATQPAQPPLPIRLAAIRDQILVAEDDEEYACITEICKIYGPDMEPLELSDLGPQDELLLWVWRQNQVLRVVAVQASASTQALLSRAEGAADEASLSRCLATLGERADRQLCSGEREHAEVLYGAINNILYNHRQADVYLMSKITLGLMLLRVHQGDAQAAYDIWMKEPPDMPFGVGVDGLEKGQVSAHDYALYRLICGWLYALGPTPSVALERVNETMGWLCSHGPAELVPLAQQHWNVHLEQLGRLTRLSFPAPDLWRWP